MRRKTHQEFITDIEKKNPNIIVLDKYVNSKVKINVECRVCHHIWMTKPNTLLSGHGCPKCSQRYNRTHGQYNIVSMRLGIHILNGTKREGETL